MKTRECILNVIDAAMKAGARLKNACKIVSLSPRTLQRWRKDMRDDSRKNNRFVTSNKLTPDEQNAVEKVCCSPEFRDRNPHQIVAILAERGEYIASESTIYRILKERGLLKHRSDSKPPQRHKPEELVADGPNQVWSWDITYLRSSVKGMFFYLYLILDVWDRSVVGWAVHEIQSGHLAAELFNKSCLHNCIQPYQLSLHQDNGGPMIAPEFLSFMHHSHVNLSYSRPGVCDDNPYSESHFRTMKYRPSFPKVFDSLGHARDWVEEYVQWYNNEHRHSRIGLVTPLQRRTGADIAILDIRRETYKAARNAHPERWSGRTRKWGRPERVVLNPRSGSKRAANTERTVRKTASAGTTPIALRAHSVVPAE